MYLAHLSPALISERIVVNMILGKAAKIGFLYEGVNTMPQSIAILKPTIFSATPADLLNIYAGIDAGVEETGPLSSSFFKMAVKGKMRNLMQKGKLDHYVYDKLIFPKIRAFFGGRVRVVLLSPGFIFGDGLFASMFFRRRSQLICILPPPYQLLSSSTLLWAVRYFRPTC